MNWFNEIESKYPVDAWKVNDVHIWPLLRVRMGYWLRKKNVPLQTPPRNLELSKKKSVKIFFHSAVTLLRFLFYYLSISKKKYLFVGAISHREKVNQIYFNKFFDPIIDKIANPARDVAIWEYDTYFPDNVYNYNEYIFPLKKSSVAFIYFQRRFRIANLKYKPDELPKFDAFVQEIKEHSILREYEKNIEEVFIYANKIKQLSVLYGILLKKLRPRLVLILCYYSLGTYPIIFACKKLGIPCADFQHGPQGNLHFAYGRWLNIPHGGFNILPKYFLTWNKASADAIDRGFRNSQFHKSVCFGHPWIDYWKDKKQKIVNGHTKKKILFSLQPVGELLTKEEITMIKSTQEHYLWFIRLHPRQLFQQQALETLIQENELKVEVNKATFQPLPSVLAQVDIHCTRSSGTIIEAAIFGVPSLLLSPSGVAYYPEEISSGIAYQPNTFDGIGFINGLKKIEERNINDHQPRESSSYRYQEILDSIS